MVTLFVGNTHPYLDDDEEVYVTDDVDCMPPSLFAEPLMWQRETDEDPEILGSQFARENSLCPTKIIVNTSEEYSEWEDDGTCISRLD